MRRLLLITLLGAAAAACRAPGTDTARTGRGTLNPNDTLAQIRDVLPDTSGQ